MKTSNKKHRNFWYGWAVDAAKHFKCKSQAIHYKYRKNDLELLNWVQNQLLIRKAENKSALELKKSIQKIK